MTELLGNTDLPESVSHSPAYDEYKERLEAAIESVRDNGYHADRIRVRDKDGNKLRASAYLGYGRVHGELTPEEYSELIGILNDARGDIESGFNTAHSVGSLATSYAQSMADKPPALDCRELAAGEGVKHSYDN